MWSVSRVALHSASGSDGHASIFDNCAVADLFAIWRANELRLDLHAIDVTPAPVFSWFKGFYDRMMLGVKTFCGVLVFRTIAAADVAAGEAEAQMNPVVAHFQALFAAVGAGRDISNFFQMMAG